MNVNTHIRKLATLALAALVGLALAASPAPAQQTGEEGSAAQAQEGPRRIQVKILGMSCPFCAYGAEQKLQRLDGVKELEVELESGIATLRMDEGADVPNEKLRATVEDAGFEASAIVRTFESEFDDWNPEEIPSAAGDAEDRDTIRATGP